jgi:hypothetical protein
MFNIIPQKKSDLSISKALGLRSTKLKGFVRGVFPTEIVTVQQYGTFYNIKKPEIYFLRH